MALRIWRLSAKEQLRSNTLTPPRLKKYCFVSPRDSPRPWQRRELVASWSPRLASTCSLEGAKYSRNRPPRPTRGDGPSENPSLRCVLCRPSTNGSGHSLRVRFNDHDVHPSSFTTSLTLWSQDILYTFYSDSNPRQGASPTSARPRWSAGR